MMRTLLPVYVICLALSAVVGVSSRENIGAYSQFSAVFNVSAFLLGLAFIVLFLMTVFPLVQRYDHMFEKDGALMFTLPVSTGRHIWNKVLSAVICVSLSLVATVVCMLVMGLCSGNMIIDFSELAKLSFSELFAPYEWHAVLIGVELLVLYVTLVAYLALMCYAAITIGHQAGSHQTLCSVAAFIGLGALESLIDSFVGRFLPDRSLVIFRVDEPEIMSVPNWIANMESWFLFAIIQLAIWAAVYFVVSYVLTDRRLNVE